jgi:hypothetical protein
VADDIESKWRNISVKGWRKRGLDKTEWGSLVRDAKAKINGLQCQRRRVYYTDIW